MTEDQIECAVERKFDWLDARFMSGRFSQAEYDAAVKDINEWAEREYRFVAR